MPGEACPRLCSDQAASSWARRSPFLLVASERDCGTRDVATGIGAQLLFRRLTALNLEALTNRVFCSKRLRPL